MCLCVKGKSLKDKRKRDQRNSTPIHAMDYHKLNKYYL